jgi:hypothetical protein
MLPLSVASMLLLPAEPPVPPPALPPAPAPALPPVPGAPTPGLRRGFGPPKHASPQAPATPGRVSSSWQARYAHSALAPRAHLIHASRELFNIGKV